MKSRKINLPFTFFGGKTQNSNFYLELCFRRFILARENKISNFDFDFSSPKKPKKRGIGNKHPKDIDFSELLTHFRQVQGCHEALRKKELSDDVVSEDDVEKLFETKLSESENIDFFDD